MDIAVIVVFFLSVFLFGFLRGLRGRTPSENVFYGVCAALSLTVLLLKSLDVPILDPIKLLSRMLH